MTLEPVMGTERRYSSTFLDLNAILASFRVNMGSSFQNMVKTMRRSSQYPDDVTSSTSDLHVHFPPFMTTIASLQATTLKSSTQVNFDVNTNIFSPT